MSPIRFHPSARLELRAAAEFYRDELPGLGRAFVSEVRAAIALISEFPQSGAPDPQGVRSVFLRRFPFTLVYRLGPEAIEIVAAMHQRQRPGYWRDRL